MVEEERMQRNTEGKTSLRGLADNNRHDEMTVYVKEEKSV
jgi:hypothetical protein